MVEITLKNGSKLQIYEMNFKGKLLDSNGTEAGGVTVYPFTEADVNKLNAQVPLQALYNGMFIEPEIEDGADGDGSDEGAETEGGGGQ